MTDVVVTNHLWPLDVFSNSKFLTCYMNRGVLLCSYIQRYQQHTILIGLCIQLVFEYAGFIIAVNFSPKMPACWAGLVSLHYFALSMFAWTALEGYCLFRQVVRVANKPLVHFHKKAILFTQGMFDVQTQSSTDIAPNTRNILNF